MIRIVLFQRNPRDAARTLQDGRRDRHRADRAGALPLPRALRTPAARCWRLANKGAQFVLPKQISPLEPAPCADCSLAFSLRSDGTVRTVDELEWHYPGASSLGLPALCVELNVQGGLLWKMPSTIGEVVAKCAAIGMILHARTRTLAASTLLRVWPERSRHRSACFGRFFSRGLTRLGRLQLAAARRAHAGTACCASPRG